MICYFSYIVPNNYAGQIAQYMHNFSLRFAFVTNYDTTIFLRQKVVNGVETILFSDPTYTSRKQVCVRFRPDVQRPLTDLGS